jgi:hypothetical protein
MLQYDCTPCNCFLLSSHIHPGVETLSSAGRPWGLDGRSTRTVYLAKLCGSRPRPAGRLCIRETVTTGSQLIFKSRAASPDEALKQPSDFWRMQSYAVQQSPAYINDICLNWGQFHLSCLWILLIPRQFKVDDNPDIQITQRAEWAPTGTWDAV